MFGNHNHNHTTATTAPPVITYPGDQAEFDAAGAEVSIDRMRGLLRGNGLTGHPTKLTVRNAIIAGELDLESAGLPIAVEFRKCRFGGPITLEQATAKAIYLVGCDLHGIKAGQLQTTFSFVVNECEDDGGITLAGAHIGGQVSFKRTRVTRPDHDAIFADGLVVDQDLRCTDGFVANGCVRLVGARIGGQLICENGRFSNPDRVALEASGLTVDQDVYWQHDLRVKGEIRLRGAHVKGRLRCQGVELDNAGGVAADLSGLAVDQDLIFGQGSEAFGGIDLTGSRIGGKLDLTGGRFHRLGGTAVDLARATVAQNMLCQSGSEVEGKLLLAGATISGGLWCEGGNIDNRNDDAIDATGLTVGRDVLFARQSGGEGFRAAGTVILNDATIGGSLNCTGGQLIKPGGRALVAKGLNVTRDVLLGNGFATDGEIDLADSTIGGCLNCDGGRFTYRVMSLKCDRIKVKQSAKLSGGFHAEGEVSLRGAQITADLDITDASLAVPNPDAIALALSGASVGGTLCLRFESTPVGKIDLSRARVGQLDDRETTWTAEVCLDGFVYSTLPTDGPGVRNRLDWLARSPRYLPQLYLQLASVYLAAGSNHDSTAVSVAGEGARQRTHTGPAGWPKRAFGALLKVTVQYGYQPLRILWWLLGLEIGGGFLFLWQYEIGALKPATLPVPPFNPFLYTLDLLVPVFSLGQRAFWIPDTGAGWAAAAFTVIGWILAACLVVGVGKIFKN